MSFMKKVSLLIYFCCLQASTTGSAQQLESGTCSSGHVVVAYDNKNDSAKSVVVSAKSWPSGELQTTVFPDTSLPMLECGDTFVRCNLTTVRDDNSDRIAVPVPLEQGVGLVVYEIANGTIQYQDQFLLEPPSSLADCHVTQFFNTSQSVLIGHCVNVTRMTDDNVRLIQLSINFTDLTQSTLIQLRTSNLFMFEFPQDTSQSVYFNERASCFEDEKDFVFLIDGFSIDRFDLTDRNFDFYTMFDQSSSPGVQEMVDCFNPRMVKRLDNRLLAIYCTNVTIELDVCRLETESVLVKTYDLNEGTVYQCSLATDSRVFVVEKNETLILWMNMENLTIPLPSDLKGIYTADCFITNGELFLVSTLSDGRTLSLNSQQQMFTTLGTSTHLIPHAMYSGPSALFNSNGNTQLYNFSCPLNPIVTTINHPFQLSTVIVSSDNSYNCMCFGSELPTPSSTTSGFSTDTTKSEETGGHTKTILAITIPTVSVVLVVIAIIIIITIIMIVKWRASDTDTDSVRTRLHNVDHDLLKPVQASDHENLSSKELNAKTLDIGAHIHKKVDKQEGPTGDKASSSQEGKITNTVTKHRVFLPLHNSETPKMDDVINIVTRETPMSELPMEGQDCKRPVPETNKEKNALSSIALPKNKPVPPKVVDDHCKTAKQSEPSNDQNINPRV